jgi:hypothetical protein
MAWKYRDVHLAWALGAVVIASCTSTAVTNQPPEQENCIWQNGDDMEVCVPPPPTGGATGNGGANMSGTAGVVPDLGTGGSSGGSVPTLGGNGGSGTGAVGGTGTGASAGDGSSAAAGVGNGGTGEMGGMVGIGGTGTSGTGTGGTGMGTTLGTIVVSAGTKNRDHTVVAFPFPAGVGKSLALRDMAGAQIPLHMNPVDGNAIFVLPLLAANMTATYTVVELPTALPNAVTAAVDANQLFVSIGTTRIFRWVLVNDNFRNRSANDVRSGYIYPLYTPAGVNVADDYASDHPHMHGLWSAWTSTTFRNHAVDFWNGYANQGHVDLKSMDGAWSGPVHAGLVANIIHNDITVTPPVTVLNEKWVVTVYKTHDGAAPYYLFDIDSVQTTATSDPLILEQYHYGGFGFRGAAEWATAASFLTSENQNRTSGDGQNARWCAMYGNVNGKIGGYAGLGHPSNVRAPQGLRIHPSNPYWAFLPTTALKGGRYTIEAGVPYKSRFRIVVFDGNADAALLNRQWDDFATPPTVQVMP